MTANGYLRERTGDGHLHAKLVPLVESLDGVSHTSPILDLGCGTGAWMARLHEAGFRDLLGVDLDAANFGASHVARFIPADISGADINGIQRSHFPLVTLIEVIEHVEDPRRLVEISANALAPGGWLLITTPNIYSLRARMRLLFGRGVPFFELAAHHTPVEPTHVHPLVLEAYRRNMFDPLGLSIERVWSEPEHGSYGSRWFARLAIRALHLVFVDDLPGDTICLLLRKPRSNQATLDFKTGQSP